MSTVLYLIPRTAVLDAILLTGHLSGAVATHVRTGGGLFEILFPVIFATIICAHLFHLRIFYQSSTQESALTSRDLP